MSEDLRDITEKIFESFLDGVKGYAEATKPEVQAFLKARAEDVGKQALLMIKGSSVEKREAPSNMKILRGRVKAQVFAQTYFATDELRTFVTGVLESGYSLIEKVGPALLAKVVP